MKFPGKRKPPAQNNPRRATVDQQRTPVFSYYSGQRRTQNTQEAPRTGRPLRGSGAQVPKTIAGHKLAWRYLPTYVVLMVFVAAFVYVLSLSSDPRVVVQQQPGIVQRDAGVYESEVLELWNKSFRNRSKLTTDTVSTRQAILDNYRELADVRIQLPLVGRRATIVLVPAAPVLQIQAQNGMFYVDANGKALVDTSHVESSASVPTVQDDSVLAVDPGKAVLPRSHVVFIVQLVTELKAVNVSIDSLTLSDKSANELDVRISGQPYYIKTQMDSDADVRQVVGAYVAVQQKLDADGVRPGEYIDVRIPDKVFYK